MIVQRRVRRNKPTLVLLDSGEWVEEEREVVFEPDPVLVWEDDGGADNS